MRFVPHILLGACALGALVPVAVRGQDGDPVRGKQLSAECFACHGVDGNSPSPINPKLAGQHELYLYLALKAYANGARSDSLMRGAVLNKSDQDLRDIAAYYAAQGAEPPGTTGAGSAPPQRTLRFDHGERNAEFASLAARARHVVDQREPLAGDVCEGAAASAPAEVVANDRNGDGFLELCNADQLARLGRAGPAALRANYQLARDIDLAAIDDFEPIGNCGPTGNCMLALGQYGFAGSFDGRGFTIRNLSVDRAGSGGVGLFGVLAESGNVVDVHLRDVDVTGRAGTGALVGSNFGVILDSSAHGEVRGELAIGGLVGGSGGLVQSSRFKGTVRGGQAVGGLVGDMTGAVYDSAVAGAVSGVRGLGGLVGLNTFGSIVGSSAAADVDGENDVGGLVGVNTDAKVWNSFAEGNVAASGNNAGGLVGFNSLSIVRNAFALGEVKAADSAGGLVGRNNGKISRGFAAGPVRGDGLSGGLVGAVVEGLQESTVVAAQASAPYGSERRQLEALTGEDFGWAPARLPVKDLLHYFCDENGNGFIDPDERRESNYVWSFGDADDLPALRCAASIEDT